MNCVGTIRQIKGFIESNWDTKFKDIKDIPDRTALFRIIKIGDIVDILSKYVKIRVTLL